jgi:hypothetical protein
VGARVTTRIPKSVFVIAGLGLLGLWLWRRHAANAAAAAGDPSYGGWPIGAVPASFTYLSSAAPSPTDTPIGGLSAVDAAALAMLQTLTDKLAGSSGGSQTTSGGTVGVVKHEPTNHPLSGDPTGSPGARNIYNVSSRDQLAAVNPSWGVIWTGPGTYEARKFNPTTPGGGSDTRVVRIG